MSSLVPEKPLLISPSLAATIGLEEAAMLTVLDELASHRDRQAEGGYQWLQLDEQTVLQYFPFWTDYDIQRIGKNLIDKGIILLKSAPFVGSRQFHFAFNEASREASRSEACRETVPRLAASSPRRVQSHNAIVRGANRIAPNWQPSDETIAQILQRGISEEFAHNQLPEFIRYWRERDEPHHAWGAKFLKHVVRAWRNHETDFQRRDNETTIDNSWQPSDDAMEVLVKHAAISQDFVEDAIPEFVLYWQERGDSSRTWNSKFIQHVRRQWNRYTATVENDTVPKTIPVDWQPGDDVFDVLRLANIDIEFAKSLVKEFVLFWRDSKQVQPSWNTKFLQHVKYHWARNHQSSITGQTVAATGTQHEQNKRRTRDRSLVDDLTDRSWAF